MKQWLTLWARLWDVRERGESLALVRIGLGLVVLYDLLDVWRLGLVRVLWAPIEEGGLGPAAHAQPTIALYHWLGATLDSTVLLFALAVGAALSLALGLFTRTSALVLLLTYAQLEALSPDADRGIDTLLRNVLGILVFAQAGATLSLDARWRHGTFANSVRIPAWPRYLIIAQLVLLYFGAGLTKDSANWSLRGDYAALYYVLQGPHHTRQLVSRELLTTLYPLTQLGAAATVLWERAACLLPLLLWLRATRERGTVVHRLVERLRLLEVWIATGVCFHLSLAALMALGIFPWGCLALYPALAHPDALRAWARKRSAALSPGAAPLPARP